MTKERKDIVVKRGDTRWYVECPDELKEFFEDKERDLFEYLYEYEMYGVFDFDSIDDENKIYSVSLGEDGKSLLRILKEFDSMEED